MSEQAGPEKRPDPLRLEALRRLPKEIIETLTRKEIDAFLYDTVWPDSLQGKLKDYLD